MATEVVRCSILTAKSRVQSHVISCEIRGERFGEIFLRFLLFTYHFNIVPKSSITAPSVYPTVSEY
jgi:hypothetical protein